MCLMHAAVEDGCVAAEEIGNLLFFRIHPSAAAVRVTCSSCESTLRGDIVTSNYGDSGDSRINLVFEWAIPRPHFIYFLLFNT